MDRADRLNLGRLGGNKPRMPQKGLYVGKQLCGC